MTISAGQVKELRERTGAGMMECKKALAESSGDMDLAIENLRKSGAAKQDKKAGRTAAEGLVSITLAQDNKTVTIVEVNCETDFAAKDENFVNFVRAVTKRIAASNPKDLDALNSLNMLDNDKQTVAEALTALIAKIGENMKIRRFQRMSSPHQFTVYQHGSRIGVIVELKGGDLDLGKDIAMHVAAARPICVSEDQVPKEVLAKEKEIFLAQAQESGKPPNILEKMVEGRLKKYLAEVALNGQPFVKEPDITVGKLLSNKKAEVISFIRMEVGEGIEKKVENFAEEVMSQVKKK